MVQHEVQRLESLIESKNGKPAPEPVKMEPVKVEEVAPETIMILTAAVAAFLGKRARIRSARLVRAAPSSAWAQQGRVFVQASHNLGVMHGR
jgi:methylmalonyl-CoA carboxyltransferase large subunit